MATSDTKICKHCQSEIPKKAKVCPVCRKKQGGKLGIILIVLGLFLVVGLFGGGSSKDGGSSSSTASSTTSSKESEKTSTEEQEVENIEYTIVNVSDMKALLDDNAMKAQAEYEDAYLEITGRLSNIDSDGKYIDLTGGEYEFVGVQCYLKNEDQKNDVMNMSKGDTITARVKITRVGEVLGYSGDVIEFVK